MLRAFRLVAMVAATLALPILGTSAHAAVCIGFGGGSNLVYGSVPEASACNGMSSGNLSEGLINPFGESWTFLAKLTPNQSNGAYDGTFVSSGLFGSALTMTVAANGLSGTWSINLAALGGLFDTFVIGLKPDGGFGYFLVGNILSGSWNVDSSNISPCVPPTSAVAGVSPSVAPAPRYNCAGFGLSHINLYGRLSDDDRDLPEPGSLVLLGAAALAWSAFRRRRAQ